MMMFGVNAFSQNTWHQLPNSPYDTIQMIIQGRIDDLYFTNLTTGYIGLAGKIYKTTDKGDNWTLIDTLPHRDYIRSIEFINDTVGFIGTISTITDTMAHLFKTTNGGYTFTKIDSLIPTHIDGICGISHYGNTVIAVGVYSEPPKFYKSIDAGNTWTVTSLSSYAAGMVDCYAFNDTTFVISGHADSTHAYSGIILHTTNGGSTWNTVALSNDPHSYVWKMFFLPDGTGMASVEYSSSGFWTTDYGATWQEVLIDTALFDGYGAVALLNDSVAWIGNQMGPGLWQTQDRGNTWNLVNFGEMEDRMVVLDSNIIVAAGETITKYSPTNTGIPTMVSKYKSHQLNIHPNPVKDNLTIKVNLVCGTNMLLDIFSDNGRLVNRIQKAVKPEGTYTYTIPVASLPSGHYIVWLRTNEIHVSQKFEVVH